MSEPSTCSIPDCERPLSRRGWCNGHYLRWYRHGDPLAGGPTPKTQRVDRVCSVDGCDRLHDSRGFCTPHYQRWVRLGDAGSAEVELRRKGAVCSVEDCDRKHYAKGYCTMHWQRWHKYGDATVVHQNAAWVGDDAGYSAIHERLVRTRGKAKEHACAHCGAPAVDWAYVGGCPNERMGERHGRLLAYSTDPDRYAPLCRACHSQHDTPLTP